MTQRIAHLLFLSSVLLFSLGCKKELQSTGQKRDNSTSQRTQVELVVQIIEDPHLAAGLSNLRGEWTERSGGQLVVEEVALKDVLSADRLQADLIIYPSRFLGTLVARNALRTVRSSVLSSDSFAIADLLPLVRNRLMPFGDQVYALPLGEPPLMIALSAAEAIEGLRKSQPQFMEDNFDLKASRRIENAAAVELLVLAIGKISLTSRRAVLFDPETMQPRIDSPPFVRALERLISLRKQMSEKRIPISLMSSNRVVAQEKSSQSKPLLPIPPAGEVYDYARDTWEQNQKPRSLIFMGFSGRVMSVTRTSRNAASAFQLLQWLASGEISTHLSQKSSATMWYRSSQTGQALLWLGGQNADQGVREEITRQLSAEDCFLLPRIPAIDSYLQILAKAVDRAQAGDLTAEQALVSAAEQWEAITEERHRDRQRAAYRKHLGYGEFEK